MTTQIEFDTRIPADERILIELKNQTDEAIQASSTKQVGDALSIAKREIDGMLYCLRWPYASFKGLETAAAVHDIRHYKSRGLTVPSTEELDTRAKEMVHRGWRPEPGNLQWCSCNACIHNCEVLRDLGIETDADHVGETHGT